VLFKILSVLTATWLFYRAQPNHIIIVCAVQKRICGFRVTVCLILYCM